MTVLITCPKCNYTGGGDWRQCGTRCPMSESPVYDPTWPAGHVSSPGKWQPLATKPVAEGVSFLVRRPGNDTAKSTAMQVSIFEGQMYPDHLDYGISWDDRVTDATAWAPLPGDLA